MPTQAAPQKSKEKPSQTILSFLPALAKKISAWFAGTSHNPESALSKALHTTNEEEDLLLEVSELDVENPGWNRPGLVAAASRLLRVGTRREVVEAIYGAQVTAEAISGVALKPQASAATPTCGANTSSNTG